MRIFESLHAEYLRNMRTHQLRLRGWVWVWCVKKIEINQSDYCKIVSVGLLFTQPRNFTRGRSEEVQIVTKDYQGQAITYQDDGWFNATQAAAKWGKAPAEWLRLPSTVEYIAALNRHQSDMGKTHITRKGNSKEFQQGTWLHPKLAVAFARWLDADFAVWCDAQIDGLIHGKEDWRKLRHASASSFKVANDILKMVREQANKDTEAHHYSNEARLINWALTGKFVGMDRDQLTDAQLDLLAYLQNRNAVLIGRGLQYDERKPIIKQYAMDWRMATLTKVPA